MAFVLTPGFVRVYQGPQCHRPSFCGPSRRAYAPSRACSQYQRQQQSPFNNFIGQLGDILSEIDQAQEQAQLEAQREAHRRRQLRKRALQARFAVNQNEDGWQIDGDFQGFAQENIHIEVPNDHTITIAGNTTWNPEEAQPQSGNDAIAVAEQTAEETVEAAPSEADTATLSPDSDTESEKSYQATVEDDFEDLGADASVYLSGAEEKQDAQQESSTENKEQPAKETASAAEKPVTSPSQSESPQEEKAQGYFERTFNFSERIDAGGVRAIFKDGKLSIAVPKAPVQEVRQIAIS